ncbi:hypothetical protein PHYPSEUDO_004210 [Phytophthora pseudosyringae]|uniref:Uncharacterized protein n=1 Tax=Phytophthora pseudosyringae TaxID=221518 RepID=A0A8T1VNN9_9STRA|nr:hypothetical protein PHYPSEUDO_004210 [Phytophthora pseudosyringae]
MKFENAEIPSSSDSEEEALSTSESECEVTSPSLSEGEEGGRDEDSDEEEMPMNLAIESRLDNALFIVVSIEAKETANGIRVPPA